MKKNFLNTLAAALLTGAVAVSGLTACSSSDDNILGEQPATEQPAAVKTYRVSIPASFGGDGAQTRAVSFDGTTSTSRFTASEKVYVYNVTNDEMMGGYLQPTDISADGKSCNLTGTLTGTGTIESENELRLFYNLTSVETNKENDFYKYYTYFRYFDNQDGTPSGVTDGAEATVTVSSYTDGVLTTTETARFENLQSMFRFQFIDESSSAISVKALRIQSSRGALIAYYFPLNTDVPNSWDNYAVTLGTATMDYIYVAMRIEESRSVGDVLTFTVTDGKGNEYKGTKAAPAGGFKNGKYYYNSSAIQLTKQAPRVKPTITWNSVDEYKDKEPDKYNRYNVYGPNGAPSEITISGISTGYRFSMTFGATIHLSSLTATYDESSDFIYSDGDLNLDISGTNTITCKNKSQAITSIGSLKLSGNGTITVTVNDSDRYGLFASSNYYDYKYDYDKDEELPPNNSDASVLAADGYTVTRSGETANVDGSYTWTYTVAPE